MHIAPLEAGKTICAYALLVVSNLRKNLDDNIVFCQDCGEEVKINNKATKTVRCEKCQQKENNKKSRLRMQKMRKCYDSKNPSKPA